MNAEYLLLWYSAAAAALIVSTVLIVRNLKQYSLPLRLVPLDVLMLILLIDLNLKSNSNITVDDPVMKAEAIAFTVLLTFVLFAPVLWKAASDRKKRRTR
jgi:hypothetical protein